MLEQHRQKCKLQCNMSLTLLKSPVSGVQKGSATVEGCGDCSAASVADVGSVPLVRVRMVGGVRQPAWHKSAYSKGESYMLRKCSCHVCNHVYSAWLYTCTWLSMAALLKVKVSLQAAVVARHGTSLSGNLAVPVSG